MYISNSEVGTYVAAYTVLLATNIFQTIAIVLLKKKRSVSRPMVLRQLDVSKEGPIYVKIVARRAGFVAWLLTLLGIDATTICEISENKIEFTEGSLSGRMQHTIPLRSICNIGTGYVKQFALLSLAIVFLGMAILLPMMLHVKSIMTFIFLFASLVLFITYHLEKRFTVFVLPPSDLGFTISIKRSVIEGVAIDENTAHEIVDIVTRLVEKRRQKSC